MADSLSHDNVDVNNNSAAICRLQAAIRGTLVRKQLNQLRDVYERLAQELDGNTAGQNSHQVYWRSANLCKPRDAAKTMKFSSTTQSTSSNFFEDTLQKKEYVRKSTKRNTPMCQCVVQNDVSRSMEDCGRDGKRSEATNEEEKNESLKSITEGACVQSSNTSSKASHVSEALGLPDNVVEDQNITYTNSDDDEHCQLQLTFVDTYNQCHSDDNLNSDGFDNDCNKDKSDVNREPNISNKETSCNNRDATIDTTPDVKTVEELDCNLRPTTSFISAHKNQHSVHIETDEQLCVNIAQAYQLATVGSGKTSSSAIVDTSGGSGCKNKDVTRDSHKSHSNCSSNATCVEDLKHTESSLDHESLPTPTTSLMEQSRINNSRTEERNDVSEKIVSDVTEAEVHDNVDLQLQSLARVEVEEPEGKNCLTEEEVRASVEDSRSSLQRLTSFGMEEESVAADMTSIWSTEHSFREVSSYPSDLAALHKLRGNIAMELLWVQQAIGSRKNYLRLKNNMAGGQKVQSETQQHS